MKKHPFYYYILVALLIIVTSIEGSFAIKQVVCDIMNYEAITIVLVATFPALFLFMILIAGCAIVYYLEKEQTYSEKIYINRRFLLETIIFSALGLGFSIATGTSVYKTFTGSNPFPCYALIFTILFSVILVCSLIIYFVYKNKYKPSELHVHRGAKGVWATIGGVAYFVYAADRFGGFLLSPVYINANCFGRYLYFFLALIMPMVIVIFYVIYRFSPKTVHNRNIRNIVSVSLLVVNLVLVGLCAVANFMIGNEFINAVSPIMIFERLVTFPFEFFILALAILIPPIVAICRWKKL